MNPRNAPVSLSALTAALAAVGLVSTAQAQVITAGAVLVNVDATATPLGPLTNIVNSGTMGGVFEARYGTNVPSVAVVNGNGSRGIRFDGDDFMQHYNAPAGTIVSADPTLTGSNPTCTIEAWVLNPGIANEETMVSWGHRNGPDGSNFAFNYGWDDRWGCMGHWGAADLGWDPCCNSGSNPPGVPKSGVWHHLVYTFDGATQRAYADGVLKNSENVGLNIHAAPAITIGAQLEADGVAVTPGLRANMTIARLRIHSEALDAAGVASNYLAEVGGFSNGGAPLTTGPIHRYDFSNLGGAATNGTVIPDIVGTAHGNIRGSNAVFTGTRTTLPGGGSGSSPYIDLPNGLLSTHGTNNGGSGQVTFEGWVKVTGNQSWSRILDFGSSDIGGGVGGEVFGPGGGGAGLDYLFLTAQEGGDVNRHVVDIRNIDPGPGTDPNGPGFDSGNFNRDYQFALTWNEATGQILVYENGSLIASMSTGGTAISDIHDVNVWLGRSNWSCCDANTQGEFDEFRIYNRVLPPEQVRQNYIGGPDIVAVTNAVSIVDQPKDLTISELQTALFTASLQGSLPVSLQWYKNNAPIPGATNSIVTESSVLPNQSGSQYYLVASNFVDGTAYVVTSVVATLTVLGDTNPPTVVQVRVNGTNQLEVVFSENVRPQGVTNTANYALTGPSAPSVIGAAVGADATRAVLTLNGPLVACEFYTLAVSGIRDSSVSSNLMSPASVSFWNYVIPGLTHRYTFNQPATGNATSNAVPDSAGNAHGIVLNNGGTATFTGSRLTLSGGASASAPYVDLPNRLLSNNSTNNGGTGKLTLEGWARVTGARNWGRIVDFGNSTAGELNGPGGSGNGNDYLFYSASEGVNTARHIIVVRDVDPLPDGSATGSDTSTGVNTATFNTLFQFVVTWDERTGQVKVYENGLEVGVFSTGAAMSEINDVNVWLGRSQWTGDENLQGELDEFRMYNRVLTLTDIQRDNVAGPDNNFGSLLSLNLAPTTNSMVTNTIGTVRVLARFSNVGTQDVAASGCVMYSSTDSNIVYISADGVIHAVNAGTATVTATLGDFNDSEIIEVTQDATPPALVSARANGLTTIEVTFSEPVEEGTAEEASNFTASSPSGPLNVIGARRQDANQAKVVLTLDTPMPCEYITVVVNFVADQSPLFNTIPDNSPISFMNYAPTALLHRYTFNDDAGPAANGAVVSDGIGTAHGAIRQSPSTFTGDRIALVGGASGAAAYVELPAGLLSSNAILRGGSGQVTFEGWTKVTGARNWGRIFDFGSSPGGVGGDYFMLSASVGTDVTQRRTEIRNEDPPLGLGQDTVDHFVTGFNRNQHYVVTWNDFTRQVVTYEDGIQVSSMVINDRMSDINDINCWLGRSNWTQDETMQGEIDEFRIYNRVLTAAEIAVNEVVGPDNNFGQPLALRTTQTNHVQLGSIVRPLAFVDFIAVSNVNFTLSGCVSYGSTVPSVLTPLSATTFRAADFGTSTLVARFNGMTNSVLITVGLQIHFRGLTAGNSYNIQVAPQVTGPWTTIGSQTAAPDGTIDFEDTTDRGTQAFYRAVLGPPP